MSSAHAPLVAALHALAQKQVESHEKKQNHTKASRLGHLHYKYLWNFGKHLKKKKKLRGGFFGIQFFVVFADRGYTVIWEKSTILGCSVNALSAAEVTGSGNGCKLSWHSTFLSRSLLHVSILFLATFLILSHNMPSLDLSPLPIFCLAELEKSTRDWNWREWGRLQLWSSFANGHNRLYACNQFVRHRDYFECVFCA